MFSLDVDVKDRIGWAGVEVSGTSTTIALLSYRIVCVKTSSMVFRSMQTMIEKGGGAVDVDGSVAAMFQLEGIGGGGCRILLLQRDWMFNKGFRFSIVWCKYAIEKVMIAL